MSVGHGVWSPRPSSYLTVLHGAAEERVQQQVLQLSVPVEGLFDFTQEHTEEDKEETQMKVLPHAESCDKKLQSESVWQYLTTVLQHLSHNARKKRKSDFLILLSLVRGGGTCVSYLLTPFITLYLTIPGPHSQPHPLEYRDYVTRTVPEKLLSVSGS